MREKVLALFAFAAISAGCYLYFNATPAPVQPVIAVRAPAESKAAGLPQPARASQEPAPVPDIAPIAAELYPIFSPASPTAQTHYTPLKALPGADTAQNIEGIEGRWVLTVGDGSGASEQHFIVVQQNNLFLGELDGQSVTGWLKGNTFSMTVRQRGDQGNMRFRYRGIINQQASIMQGQVSVDGSSIDDQSDPVRAIVNWVAYRE